MDQNVFEDENIFEQNYYIAIIIATLPFLHKLFEPETPLA